MAGVIVIYLGRTAVVIDIKNQGVDVAVKGTTLTVTGPDKRSVKVEPGEQELKITCAGLETTTKHFSLMKGERKTVTVLIVNKEIVALLENEVLPLKHAHVETASNPADVGTKAESPSEEKKLTNTEPGILASKPNPNAAAAPVAQDTASKNGPVNSAGTRREWITSR